MRTDDLTRRLLQAEREIQVLRDEIERLRANRSSGLMPSQVQVLQPIVDIDGRDPSGADFVVSYSRAKIWDIQVASVTDTGGTLGMKLVQADGTPRYALLLNTWTSIISEGSFVIGSPYKGMYLPISEEC